MFSLTLKRWGNCVFQTGFFQGRQRIKLEAFQELYQEVVLNFYEKAEITSWEGYQLFGIDGTRLNLPCTEELAQLYGVQTSQERLRFRHLFPACMTCSTASLWTPVLPVVDPVSGMRRRT